MGTYNAQGEKISEREAAKMSAIRRGDPSLAWPQDRTSLIPVPTERGVQPGSYADRTARAGADIAEARAGVAKQDYLNYLGATARGENAQQIQNRSAMVDLREKEAQAREKSRFRQLAGFAARLQQLTPGKDGRVKLTDDLVGMLPGIVPGFSGITSGGKRANVFIQPGKSEGGQDTMDFFTQDDDGAYQPLLYDGQPMRPQTSVMAEAARLGQFEMGLGATKQKNALELKQASVTAGQDPAQVKLVKFLAEKITNGDMQAAWTMAQQAKSNPRELAAKLFLAEKKNLARQYEFSPEDMPDDTEIMRGIQDAMKALDSFQGTAPGRGVMKPENQKQGGKLTDKPGILSSAKGAIAKGAPKDKVRERLLGMGFTDAELTREGL